MYRCGPHNRPSGAFAGSLRETAIATATLAIGIAEDALPGTIWILERSNDLRTFEELYRFDGTTHTRVDGLPVDIATTASGVIITDQAPPAGSAFYRFRADFSPPG